MSLFIDHLEKIRIQSLQYYDLFILLALGAHKYLEHGAMNGPFQMSILIWKCAMYAEIDEIFLFKSWNSS